MKRYVREFGTVLLVTASAFVGFQLQGSNDLEQRVDDLEDRVAVLEREGTDQTGDAQASNAAEYTIDLQINLGGKDGQIWVSTDARGCEGVGGASDMQEGFEIVVRDEQDQEVGIGSFEEGRQTAFGCVVRAEIPVAKADYYYLTVGPWENFEAAFDSLEDDWDWDIVLTAQP